MRFWFRQQFFFVLFLCAFSTLLCSCGAPETPRIVIGNDFYYWESSADATFGDAMQNMRFFKKLEDNTTKNLRNVLGRGSHYVWVRAEFEIPPQFKNKPLGLVIPHLRFAEQLWCNGNFISQYGEFPPHEQSTLFKAHFFSLPVNLLNQDGKNMIMIRIYAQGKSGISSHAFIQPTRFAYPAFEKINFLHTRIYMPLTGILVFTFILYLCFFINVPNFKEFRDFALLNLFTSFFITPFFATELPPYTNGVFQFLSFYKLSLCIPAYFIIYFATMFSIHYHHLSYTRTCGIVQTAMLSVQVIATLIAPSYEALVRITPFMLALLAIQGLMGATIVVREICRTEHRQFAFEFLLGFLPLSLSALLDIALRLHDKTQVYPYFSIFGWQISIAIFIILLATRFAGIYRKSEQLSNHLQEEVATRTSELQDANYELSLLNERLEKDKRHSEMDLEMAAIVQKNFFPQPNTRFRGWDIAICYAPQAKVSGDLYDYYSYNDILNGISLFDVSGHGLSASLVTMLSKNIISRVFQTGFRRKETVDKILSKINNMILSEKGDIDNYMTGILCRFENEPDSDECTVELGNAGHPYPLKFSAQDNEIFELKGNDGKKHYGAIGMQGITVSFARSNFCMKTGDILVLYTDGITEAVNPRYDQFGLEPIKFIIKQHHDKSPSEILSLIMERLRVFTQEKPLEDDITLIIAKRTDMNAYISSEEERDDDSDEQIEELETSEQN